MLFSMSFNPGRNHRARKIEIASRHQVPSRRPIADIVEAKLEVITPKIEVIEPRIVTAKVSLDTKQVEDQVESFLRSLPPVS